MAEPFAEQHRVGSQSQGEGRVGVSQIVGANARQPATGDEPIEGFWWVYVPLRFDDYAIVIILQEEADGHRIMNEAVRVWPEPAGTAP